MARDFGIAPQFDRLDWHLESKIAGDARLITRAPSIEELVDIEAEKHNAQFGSPMLPGDRMTIAR